MLGLMQQAGRTHVLAVLLRCRCWLMCAHCWLLCAHCLLMSAHCLLMCAHCWLMCAHCLVMCSHCVCWCRRRMLMDGQMKRLLRKPGRTTESATTQPLWITFRHAATLVSGSCLLNSLIRTLPFKSNTGSTPFCHGACSPLSKLLVHEMLLTRCPKAQNLDRRAQLFILVAMVGY